ncbi:polygalacturonase At1g48100-like [Rutidosis leptorrhynchoides]|uniref:polygalacturonase At1g48100-like n=1 Tax=Rutidosis leptorrhynchoides TaxID=125765 RepID=UPI003A998CAD
MSTFTFKNFTVVLLTTCLICFSSSEICNARRGKYWRHKGSEFSTLYNNKVQHQANGDKSETQQSSTFNVLDYGAKGDGKSDDIKAFQAAWADACKSDSSTIIVPSGYKFLVGPTSFSGSNCHKRMSFQVDGTILAPTNSEVWSSGVNQWLEFTELVEFTIKGNGTLDGSGSVWWSESLHDDSIKNENDQVTSSLGGKMPKNKPMAVRVGGGSDVTVTGITIQNSPQFHLAFENCDGVLVYGISISSPGDSPNTDGIHLSSSKNVIIHHTNLACGDDCISIQTGCSNVLVHDVNCGPGHGISIGSLGIDGTTACVSNITVQNIKIQNTMTGVRIKTWQGAAGLVQGVTFSNIQVSEVEYPIMIDQYYCDHSSCKNETSAVSITNIEYENIFGTYTVQPVHLSCSDSKPCMDLRLSDIELQPKSEGQEISKPFCWQAFGTLDSPIVPEIDCLREGGSSNSWDVDNSQCEV